MTGYGCVMNTIGQRRQTDNVGGREDGDGVMALGRGESVRSSTHVQEVVEVGAEVLPLEKQVGRQKMWESVRVLWTFI